MSSDKVGQYIFIGILTGVGSIIAKVAYDQLTKPKQEVL